MSIDVDSGVLQSKCPGNEVNEVIVVSVYCSSSNNNNNIYFVLKIPMVQWTLHE